MPANGIRKFGESDNVKCTIVIITNPVFLFDFQLKYFVLLLQITHFFNVRCKAIVQRAQLFFFIRAAALLIHELYIVV